MASGRDPTRDQCCKAYPFPQARSEKWGMTPTPRSAAMAFRSISCSERIESGLWTDTSIERLMSHKERNNVRAAYIHKAEFIEERRLIMNWWSRHLKANQQKHVSPREFANQKNRCGLRSEQAGGHSKPCSRHASSLTGQSEFSMYLVNSERPSRKPERSSRTRIERNI